jgi:hypothetical protein
MDLVKQSNESFDAADGKRKERVEVIAKEIEQWESRLDRLYDFVETKAIEPGRMAERIAEVQDKLNQMRQTKLELENIQDPKGGMYIDPQKVLSYVAELRQFLDERGLFERKAFLRSFIEKIRIGDDKITLDYTLPLQPNNSKQETFSVLDIVSSAPPKISSQRDYLMKISDMVSFLFGPFTERYLCFR